LRPVPWTAGDGVKAFVIYWLGFPLLLVLGLYAGAWLWQPLKPIVQLWTDQNVVVSFAFNLLIDAAGLMVVWHFVKKRDGHLNDLGWRRFDVFAAIGFVVLGFILLILTVAGIAFVVQHFFPIYDTAQPQTNEFTSKAAIGTNWALMALVVMPPIIEETIFRGFLLPALATKAGFWPATLAVSLVFALAHGQANVGVYTFLLSIVTCFMYRRFDSIVPGVLLHMLNNLITYWAMLSR